MVIAFLNFYESLIRFVAIGFAAISLAACQSGPPPAPKTEVATEKVILSNWLQVRFCTDGENTVNGKLIRGRLCSKVQEFDVFGGPIIQLAGQHGSIGSLSPQEATKGFSVAEDGIIYTLKCDRRPWLEGGGGQFYHCAYDAGGLPLIRVDILYP